MVLAKKRGISWTDIASTSVGKINAHKVSELWTTKPGTKKSKYGNVKTIVDGIKFHSKGESERYIFLKSSMCIVYSVPVKLICLPAINSMSSNNLS